MWLRDLNFTFTSPFFFTRLSSANIHTLTSSQEVKNKRLSQHHLAGSQHAAPAAVWGQSGAGQGREIRPVGEPHLGAEILTESLHIPHDKVLTRGVAAGVRWTVVIWGKQIIQQNWYC